MSRGLVRLLLTSSLIALIVPALGCGGGGGDSTPPPTPPTPTNYTLTVNTSNPDTGVTVSVSPSDNSGNGNGSSSMTRTYSSGTTVTLIAPTTSGTKTFNSWQGCTSKNANTCTVTLTANTTVTAYYVSPVPTAWNLVWSDEFNAAVPGTAPDSSKWGYDLGVGTPNGWGNSELECYTNSTNNSYQDGSGNLVIAAMKETGACSGQKNYTSARLLTKSKFTQQYGRIEARIKLPYGQGIWPAFWGLGDNIDSVSWPACGEIDIMESVTPLGQHVTQSSLHAPNFDIGKPVDLGVNINDDYHVYGVIWTPNQVQFYVDDPTHPFITYTPADMGNTGQWKFNHPFFLILNVAVGGNWPGAPNDSTTFANGPQKMYVDWVRVYDDNVVSR